MGVVENKTNRPCCRLLAVRSWGLCALAGGVVLTTVTDVIGILAFIGLASYVLLAN